MRLSHFTYHTLTSHWCDAHRGWWSHCLNTQALLETEQMGKRHPCSGRPQEEQRRNALPRKQRQEPRALSAKVTLLVLRCPGTACQIQPWSLPDSLLALAPSCMAPLLCIHSLGLPPPEATSDLQGYLLARPASGNAMLDIKISHFPLGLFQSN